MAKPSATLNTPVSAYEDLADLGNIVFASMTGNATYATPSPALATIQTATTDVEDAIIVWGPVGNRGSHADLLDLRNKALILRNLLLAEAQYVTGEASIQAGNDYVLMASLISTSGFGVKNSPSPQGPLGAPENLHQVFGNSISIYAPKLDWKKMTGLKSPNNCKGYKVLRNTVNNFLTATVIATTTKTSFIDNTVVPGTQYYYWVLGFNAAGDGTESNNVLVSVPN